MQAQISRKALAEGLNKYPADQVYQWLLDTYRATPSEIRVLTIHEQSVDVGGGGMSVHKHPAQALDALMFDTIAHRGFTRDGGRASSLERLAREV